MHLFYLFLNRATHWQLNYEILVNGTMVDPLTVTPLSYTLLPQKLDQQVGHGNYFLSPDLAFNFNLVPWQYYTGLFTYEWIAPWQYQTFIDLLVQYYQAKYTGEMLFNNPWQ